MSDYDKHLPRCTACDTVQVDITGNIESDEFGNIYCYEHLPNGPQKEKLPSFTNQRVRVATEKDCRMKWAGGGEGEYFRCYLCGHKFRHGDLFRFVFGREFGNIFGCRSCDGADVLVRWATIVDQSKIKYWWLWKDVETANKNTQYEEIEEWKALIETLPGGTIDRLLCYLLTQKANYFQVPYVAPKAEANMGELLEAVMPFIKFADYADEYEKGYHNEKDTSDFMIMSAVPETTFGDARRLRDAVNKFLK